MDRWEAVAMRAVEGLGVGPGELVQVRDGAGRPDVLEAMVLAVERWGGTPVPELAHPTYLRRLLGGVDPALLARWADRRVELMGRYDRVLVLHGDERDGAGIPAAAWSAWLAAVHQVVEAEEARRLPVMVVAVPTGGRAAAAGRTLESLEEEAAAAMLLDRDEIVGHTDDALGAVLGTPVVELHSGEGLVLRLDTTGRTWLVDDGHIDEVDRHRGAVVSNLPAGSAYTTVVEAATEGRVRLVALGGEEDVVLRFEGGRARVEATRAGPTGVSRLEAWLDGFSGEPRRVGHLGLGTNPALSGHTGWVLLDHGAAGRAWLSLGENRYMGGDNASTLNVDAVVVRGRLRAPAR